MFPSPPPLSLAFSDFILTNFHRAIFGCHMLRTPEKERNIFICNTRKKENIYLYISKVVSPYIPYKELHRLLIKDY